MRDGSVWPFLMTVAMTGVGALISIVYRDIMRRMAKTENKIAAVLMVQLFTLGQSKEIPPEVLDAIHKAISE